MLSGEDMTVGSTDMLDTEWAQNRVRSQGGEIIDSDIMFNVEHP